MARRRGIITIAIIAAMGLSHAPASHAQFGGVVYDPANYVQNFYTAVRSYTQIIRQAQQLRNEANMLINCLLYTSPSPRDLSTSRMPSSA